MAHSRLSLLEALLADSPELTGYFDGAVPAAEPPAAEPPPAADPSMRTSEIRALASSLLEAEERSVAVLGVTPYGELAAPPLA
eukprot:1547963-Prymnesium_polylepis.1